MVPEAVALLDCDVEEPNCHIFLAPTVERSEAIGVLVPVVDPDRCLACGSCSRFCQYHAIAGLDTGPLIFPELCHSCGGCVRVCPTGALSETTREIGVVEEGWAGRVRVIQGRLRITEASSPPLIRAVKKRGPVDGITLIDCPPGTSCPVIAALRGVDFAILVTEPTPFGLHDLRLAVGMVRTLNIPFGVVVNRTQDGNRSIRDYCETERIPILLEIPDSRQVAEAYSRGQSVLTALPGLRSELDRLYRNIKTRVRPGTGSEPCECTVRRKRPQDQPAGTSSESQSRAERPCRRCNNWR
ncbi:MAG: (4Fe-4S)-binding protein [Acidobacteria bacterium]|nr:MAG: (4Fe-4S)-binding protein [Acidobacteriota bacterium]